MTSMREKPQWAAEAGDPVQSWLIDWLIEDILQAPSTMSGDLRA